MCKQERKDALIDACVPIYKAELRDKYTAAENAIFDTMLDRAIPYIKEDPGPMTGWASLSLALVHFWHTKATPCAERGSGMSYETFPIYSYVSKHSDLAQNMLHEKVCSLWKDSISSHMFAFQTSCLEEMFEPKNQWFLKMLALGCPEAGFEKRSREEFVEDVYSRLTDIRRGLHCTHWDRECACIEDSRFVAAHWNAFLPIFEAKRKALEKGAS